MRKHNSQLDGFWRMGLLLAVVGVAPMLCGCPKSQEPRYYIPMLASTNDEVHRRGVEELARMQVKALPALKEALKSPDANTRKGALEVLARIRTMDALTATGELVSDPDKDTRIAAIDGVAKLAQVWKQQAVELLTKAFDQSDPPAVKEAAIGLADMRFDGATAVLQRGFDAGKGVQATYAAKLLYEAEPSPKLASFLLDGLRSGDEAVRSATEESIKELEDRFVEPLVTSIVSRPESADQARRALMQVRDVLTDELGKTLDSKRAAEILNALGMIADQKSIEKLVHDFADTGLETIWRVSAAQGMGIAAQSPRALSQQKTEVIDALTKALRNESEDNRVRIGAAIALCQLRKEEGVKYLLDELDRFQEIMGKGAKISAARLKDLTRLRISAQEALTTSGQFVVPALLERARKPAAGPIILWAAAKTAGELKVKEALPLLGQYVSATAKAKIALGPDGGLARPVSLTTWQSPAEEEVTALQADIEEFKYPGYVRLAAAIALGQIGGPEGIESLKKAEAAETDFVQRLKKNKDQAEYYKRASVIEGLVRRHEDVSFYIRRALAAGSSA
jgi:HEAT repeat protein